MTGNDHAHTFPVFEELYEKLTPALGEIETKRKALVHKSLNVLFVVVPVAVLVVGIIYAYSGNLIFGIVPVALLSYFVVVNIGKKEREAFLYEYKQRIIGEMVKYLLENGRYAPESGILLSVFDGCNLFRTPDRYSSEDLISGFVGKTQLLFSEVHAEEKRVTVNSKGRREEHWVDIFKGFIFVADFNKHFAGRTEVHRNSWFKPATNRVWLENVEFEEYFDVYATDQIEARYILTPSLMERIIALEHKFKNRSMILSFYDSNVVIAVRDSRNNFEAGIWSSVSDSGKLQEEYNTISTFIGIMEDLNLNLRIWTKE